MAARDGHREEQVLDAPGNHHAVRNRIDRRGMAEEAVEVYASRLAFAHGVRVEWLAVIELQWSGGRFPSAWGRASLAVKK